MPTSECVVLSECWCVSKSYHRIQECVCLPMVAEGREEARDKAGRRIHVVALEPDTAQVVLDVLQAAVFTGKLPDCTWQVSPSTSH